MFYSVDVLRALRLGDGLSARRDCWRGKGGTRVDRSVCNKAQAVKTSEDYCERKPDLPSLGIQRFCIIGCRSLGSLQSFLQHVPPGPVPCVIPSWVSSGCSVMGGCSGWWRASCILLFSDTRGFVCFLIFILLYYFKIFMYLAVLCLGCIMQYLSLWHALCFREQEPVPGILRWEHSLFSCWTTSCCCSVMMDSLQPQTVAHQAPLSMGFSRQEYWSGLPCPPPRDLPSPGIEPPSLMSPLLRGDSLPLIHQGSPLNHQRSP